MKEYAIAIDLGGTNTRVAAVDGNGEIIHRISRPSRAQEGKDEVVQSLLFATEEVLQIGKENFRGIGIGVAGAIDLRTGTITQSPNFPGWDHVPLKEIIEDTMAAHLPVFLENDANAAALGERWKGAGAGSNDMVCLTIGTGIGGGVIVNGILLHGADGMASELGHITVDPQGPPCKCGNSGCLEALCSGTAVQRSALKALRAGQDSALAHMGKKHRQGITAKMIASAAHAGDSLSRIIYEEMGRYLGIGIATLVNIFNPEIVVIGGQVSKAWDLFIPAVRKEIQRRALHVPAQRAALVPARQGDDAGLIGAAYLVFSSGG